MNRSAQFQKSLLATTIAIGALSASTWQAEAGAYFQTNLVSDGFLPAQLTDPTMVNPWGVSHSATSPFWTSNQGTSTTSLFNVTTTPPTKNPTVAPSIPPGGAVRDVTNNSYWLSQRRMNPSSPCGMKITIAMKMSPTGMR